MRCAWEALYESLVNSIRVAGSVGTHHKAFSRRRELERFEYPLDIVIYLRLDDGDLDAKDSVLEALVTMRQQGEQRQLALSVLMLGLWPGLDAAFKRRARRENIERAEVAAAMYDHFAGQVDRMDFSAVNRVAATLVRSTEREVAADLRRQRVERNKWCSEQEQGASCGAADSLFDVPAGVDARWEMELLRDRISEVAGRDAQLVVAVAAVGLTQAQAAVSLGLTHEAARKRYQRARRQLLEWLQGDDESEAQPAPTKKDSAMSIASPKAGGESAPSLCRGKVEQVPAAPSRTPKPRIKQMTQDMWKQTEEMAKRHEAAGSSWLKLLNDGDRAVVVFLGAPFPHEVCFVQGKYVPFDDGLRAQGLRPTLRVAFNVALVDTMEVKVFEQGVMFFMDLVRVRDKYGLENWAFEVKRHGAARDPKTTYSILPEKQLSADEYREFAALQLLDLPRLYESRATDEQARDSDAPIDPQLALTLTTTLKALPRQAVDQFCEKFRVRRIKDLSASQSETAKVFVEALVMEFSPDTAVDPFA